MINIGKQREVLWDDHLIDTEKTTVTRILHHPVRRETVLRADKPWEGDRTSYFNFYTDENGVSHLYYLGMKTNPESDKLEIIENAKVCYAESRDGIHWEKPDLGLYEWNGDKHNNIVLGGDYGMIPCFMVFNDPNPDCPKNEKIKAIGMASSLPWLWCFPSEDGIHFRKGWQISFGQTACDSLNTVTYDPVRRRYILYLRHRHDGANEKDIRDIRYCLSEDFHTWSEPEMLIYNEDSEDYPVYTNNISNYYRAGHMFVGFPTRYNEHKLSDSLNKLCGHEHRVKRMSACERYGTAVTDCVFMCSRDGINWNRIDEAFMRPGAEYDTNWTYGSCYPALGMRETPGEHKGEDNVLSMYCIEDKWMAPTALCRYTLRPDGFVSRRATLKPQILTTKPFAFDGDTMFINFSTSARGYIRIRITDEHQNSIESDNIFGDRTDREVGFNGHLLDFSGKTVVMEITMSDSDLYSFRFSRKGSAK